MVLVLTSSTGGGHNMRARALEAWAESPQGAPLGLEVTIHQALETTSRIYAMGVWLYNVIQRNFPRAHHVYFQILEWLAPVKRAGLIRGAAAFQELVREVEPDIVLSTHPHLNHGFMELAVGAGLASPPRCVTYCGELHHTYGFSRCWVNPKLDLFIGAVETTCRGAIQTGMPPEKTAFGGFLLKPDFYRPPMEKPERDEYMKDQLRLDPDKFTLVLATGANGANNHIQFLDAMARAGIQPQVVALCGKNSRIQMAVLQWAAAHRGWKVRAVGYYPEMHLLLQAADAVVARPGTGTTSEAILCGCPIIFNTIGGAMPQEMITMRFFEEHNWPKPVGRARSLPNRVKYWMENREHLQHARRVMAELEPERHPLEIIRMLRNLTEDPEKEQKSP